MESKQEEKFVLKQAEEELKKQQEAAKEEREGKPAAAKESKEEKKEADAGKKDEKKAPAKAGEKKGKEEKKREIILERVYTIPMKMFLVNKPRMKRHTITSHIVRLYAAKHMKTPESKVKIEAKVWEQLSRDGRNKMAGKIKVKASKDKEGIVLIQFAS